MSVYPQILAPLTTPGGLADLSRLVTQLQQSGYVIPPQSITGGGLTGQITAASITATEIAAGAIVAGTIAVGAITAGTIAAGAVTAGTIAAGAVTATTIAAGAVTATSIAVGALSAVLVSGDTIQTAASGARVVIDSLGIRAYDTTGTQRVGIDATTGLITATGIITSQPGSTVPWQTTGFYVGGGNLVSNASFEDPTQTLQILYASTGAGVTAGTFTITVPAFTDPTGVAHGSYTTTALAWNASAATIQTALQLSGWGTNVTAAGGPFPNPVYLTIVAESIKPVLATTTSTLTGGTAVIGPSPLAWNGGTGVPDVIPMGSSFHGGNVMRLTSQAAGSTLFSYGIIGPFSIPPGTGYTSSAYYRSAVTARTPWLQLIFADAFGVQITSVAAPGSFSTNTSSWQRMTLTTTSPPLAQRQKVLLTGAPTGGTFKLVYNGQTTANINWNDSAATVLSKIQALSNVGASGAGAATGGPLPAEVDIGFLGPAGTPTTMTVTASALTGGSSPAVSVSNQPAVFLYIEPIIVNAAAGEVHYVDAVQVEVGDVPTAFAPRPDEILANTITANMILVNQLSAISGNIGTVTAGNILGATITGSVVQSASTDPRVRLDSTFGGLFLTDVSANKTVTLDPTNGMRLLAGSGNINQVEWMTGNIVSGTIVGEMRTIVAGNTSTLIMYAEGPGGGTQTGFQASADSVTDANNVAQVTASDHNSGVTFTSSLLDGKGRSDYLMISSSVATPAPLRSLTGAGTLTFPGGSQNTNQLTVALTGAAGTVRGVATAAAFATNGSIVAITQVFPNGTGGVVIQGRTVDGTSPANTVTCPVTFIIWGS